MIKTSLTSNDKRNKIIIRKRCTGLSEYLVKFKDVCGFDEEIIEAMNEEEAKKVLLEEHWNPLWKVEIVSVTRI